MCYDHVAMEKSSDFEFLSDDELDGKIVHLRAEGRSEHAVGKTLGVPISRIRSAVKAHIKAALSPEAQMETLVFAGVCIDRVLSRFVEDAAAGDYQAAMALSRLLEVRRGAVGLTGPHAANVIHSLAEQAIEEPAPTKRIRQAMQEFLLDDPKRLRNGGVGYSTADCPDLRDEDDRRYLEQRAREAG